MVVKLVEVVVVMVEVTRSVRTVVVDAVGRVVMKLVAMMVVGGR